MTIVIIALLTAGVFSGQKLVQNSKLQNVIKEIREYDSAIKQFKDKFKYYPGDLPNASAYWTSASGTNGDGNWFIIDTTTESLYAWQHLVLAGFITGSYTGALSSPNYKIGVNVPGSKFDSYALYFLMPHINSFSTTGHALSLSRLSDGNGNTNPYGYSIMTPNDTFLIDKKIDDGLAASGNLYAVRGLEGSLFLDNTKCVNAEYSSDPTGQYVLTDTTASCRLYWWLDKNK